MKAKGNPINEVLKLALSVSSDGFIVLNQDHIVWINERAQEIMGKRYPLVLGASIDEIISEEAKKKY